VNLKAKKWNQRYRELEKLPKVNESVKRFAKMAKRGRALDIACGAGQNALYLSNLGFKVDAIDIASEGLKFIENRPSINTIETDITQYEPPKEGYDLIVSIHFLERSIFPKIPGWLKEGGLVICETFTYKKQNFNPAYTLQKNELLHLLDTLEIIHYKLQGDKALAVAKKL